MKLGDTGLDDVFNEVQFLLRDDGRRRVLLLLRLLTWVCRALKAVLLLVCRLRWHCGALERKARPMPALGCEPFNLTDADLEREWGLHE